MNLALLPHIIAAVLALSILIFFIVRLHVPGASIMFIAMAGCAIWSIAYVLELSSENLSQRIFWSKIQYLGIVVAPVSIFQFLWIYVQGLTKSLRWINLLYIVPMMVLVLVFSFPHLKVHWYSFKLGTENGILSSKIEYAYGFYFWLLFTYGMFLTTISLFIYGFTKRPSLFRQRFLSVLLSLILPLIVNMVYVFRLIDSDIDYTPVAYSLAAAYFTFSLFRFNASSLLPFAYERLFQELVQGILVINSFNEIVDMNPEAENILDTKKDDVLGEKIIHYISNPYLQEKLKEKENKDSNIILKGLNNRDFEVHLKALSKTSFERKGYMLIFQDITRLRRRNKKLLGMARKDELTGLYNRRYFREQSEVEIKRAIRYNYPLSFILIDLDFFKAINDNFGHKAGDTVLKKFSRLLIREIREIDLISRIGGEEFSIVLPRCDEKAAYEIAERLRLVASRESFLKEHPNTKITISVGVTSYKTQDTGVESLFERADKALYKVKRSGRDGVAVFRENDEKFLQKG